MKRFLLALLLLPACSSAHGSASRAAAPPEPEPPVWRVSAVQAMDFLRPVAIQNETCRQVLRLSVGGQQVRLRLSNVLSQRPLRLAAVSAGLRAQGAAARPGSLRPVTVAGAASFTVPAGEQVMTDPVELVTAGGHDLLVSFAVDGTATLTGHRIGARTGWCSASQRGDRTRDEAATAFPRGERAGLVVEEASVTSPAGTPLAVIAVGDSLTDAPFAPDVHPRWPEVVAERLPGTPVADAAVAGNRVLLTGGFGIPLAQRFATDVLQRSGAGTVVLLAGTNDLERGLPADALGVQLARLCEAARADGLRVVLATIPPASARTPAQQAARRQVNAWIRTQAPADLVVDADKVLRSPADAEVLRPEYDDGDGLHLSPAGQQALGAAVARVLG